MVCEALGNIGEGRWTLVLVLPWFILFLKPNYEWLCYSQWFSLCFCSYPVAFRGYYWLFALKSQLEGSGDHMGSQESNPGSSFKAWTSARPVLYHYAITPTPHNDFIKIKIKKEEENQYKLQWKKQVISPYTSLEINYLKCYYHIYVPFPRLFYLWQGSHLSCIYLVKLSLL